MASTLVFLALLADQAAAAAGRAGVGVRAGLSRSPDQFLVGGQLEVGPVFGPAYLAPSLDFGFGDPETVAIVNADLRWYLLPLPDTGLQFYGAIGPAVLLSPDTELGFTLTAGLHIPMQGLNRYNVEVRFGFGDIPEVKFAAAVLFGLR
jgi:hypothetical protein